MHCDVTVLKLKSNGSESQKKNAVFWTTFFLSILEAGASAVILAQTLYS